MGDPFQWVAAEIIAHITIDRLMWGLGGVVATMFGFWGLRKRIKALEHRQFHAPLVQIVDHRSDRADAGKQTTYPDFWEYDGEFKSTTYFTRFGDLNVRMDSAETVHQGIRDWLISYKLYRPTSMRREVVALAPYKTPPLTQDNEKGTS